MFADISILPNKMIFFKKILGSSLLLPAHWEGGARATLISPLRGRKAWPPARARRKGGGGGIPPRPSVPPERSGGVKFLKKSVGAEFYIPPNINFSVFPPPGPAGRSAERYGNTGSPRTA